MFGFIFNFWNRAFNLIIFRKNTRVYYRLSETFDQGYCDTVPDEFHPTGTSLWKHKIIREALEDSCRLINGKENIFEKALLALVLLSYIQAFSDGNKRTARITSNAILIANKYCPISFRTVDSVDYKKAMLIFYEQNNISAFKKIFIDQFAFAVQTYF